MVNKYLYPAGGAEAYMFKIGKYMKEKGDQVEYFGMYHPDNIVGNRWKLYTENMDFHSNRLINPLKIIRSADAEKKMKNILEQYMPDVIHINNFNYQLTPSILVAAQKFRREKAPHMRIVYTAHDPQLVCPNHYLYQPALSKACEKCLKGKYYHCILGRCIHNSVLRSCIGAVEAMYWKHKKIYEVFDVIICPSYFLKEKLDTDTILANKTVFLRNFVRPIRKKEKSKGTYILYFGRYSVEKGILPLLDACRKLKDIPFVFVGEGPLAGEIEAVSNIRNVGFLEDKELDQYIGQARFTVCPSICNDNCPFSVIESIMQGTPVLGSFRGGIPELIENGKNGWLVDVGNSEELVNRIKKLWYSSEPEVIAQICKKSAFDSLYEYGDKLRKLYSYGLDERM